MEREDTDLWGREQAVERQDHVVWWYRHVRVRPGSCTVVET